MENQILEEINQLTYAEDIYDYAFQYVENNPDCKYAWDIEELLQLEHDGELVDTTGMNEAQFYQELKWLLEMGHSNR